MSDWEASSTVTIELPSPDQLSARRLYICMCAAHAHGSLSPKSLCSVEAMLIVFTPSRPRIAPFFVGDEVLARDREKLLNVSVQNLDKLAGLERRSMYFLLWCAAR
jgi:hypothetical protein